MPRSHPLAAAAMSVLALVAAWVGTAYALASTDPNRLDSIDAGLYVLAAISATCLVVASCVCSVPWGLLAGTGVVAGLSWGATESHDRLDVYSGGWMGGFDDVVFLVPIVAAVVALVALVTCTAVAVASPRERAGGAPGSRML